MRQHSYHKDPGSENTTTSAKSSSVCCECQEKGVLGVFTVRGAHSEKFHLSVLKPQAALLLPVEINVTITSFNALAFRLFMDPVGTDKGVCDLVITV